MSDARIYPCADCGVMRSKAEGGTVFTVCDECWDKHHPGDDFADLVQRERHASYGARLRELVERHPNDAELGAALRALCRDAGATR